MLVERRGGIEVGVLAEGDRRECGEEITGDDEHRPHVDVRMVGPDDDGRPGRGLEHAEAVGGPGERGARLIEDAAQGAVDGLALGDRMLTPATGQELDLGETHLVVVIGEERRAQGAVPLHDRPPGGGESIAVDVAGQAQRERHPRSGAGPGGHMPLLVERDRAPASERPGHDVVAVEAAEREVEVRHVGQTHVATLT